MQLPLSSPINPSNGTCRSTRSGEFEALSIARYSDISWIMLLIRLLRLSANLSSGFGSCVMPRRIAKSDFSCVGATKAQPRFLHGFHSAGTKRLSARAGNLR